MVQTAERVIDLRVAGAAHAGPRPVMLAVAGDSASGKTTLAEGIRALLGEHRVTRICVDDYHRHDRSERERLGITPLHPEANDLPAIERHLRALARGDAVDKPVYDHATGRHTDPVMVEPKEVVIVEGLLALGTRGLRDCFDVSVYLEPEEELRHRWKIARDCEERGYEIAQVVADLRRRERDSALYVRPQAEHADVVVSFLRRTNPDAYANLGARIALRPSLLSSELANVVRGIPGGGRREPVRLARDRSLGTPVQVVEIDGDCPAVAGAAIEQAIWTRLGRPGLHRTNIGRYEHPSGDRRRSEALALTQLLIVAHLSGSLRGALDL
ncbi:MAG: phosphoribulokinase [Actinomycetota bacterium]